MVVRGCVGGVCPLMVWVVSVSCFRVLGLVDVSCQFLSSLNFFRSADVSLDQKNSSQSSGLA